MILVSRQMLRIQSTFHLHSENTQITLCEIKMCVYVHRFIGINIWKEINRIKNLLCSPKL